MLGKSNNCRFTSILGFVIQNNAKTNRCSNNDLTHIIKSINDL